MFQICLFILAWLFPNARAGHIGFPGSAWEGTVLHEMPELYEADGKTLKPGTGKTPLRMITNRPESGGVGDAMGRLVPILRMGLRAINKDPDILPDYVVELHLCESGCANQKAVQSTLRQIYNHSKGFFHIVFGPLCSGPTAAVNDIVQGFHLFQVATISRSALLSDGTRYPYLCRTSPPLQFVADGIAKFLQLFGYTKIGTVYDSRSLSAATVNAFKSAVRDSVTGKEKFERNDFSSGAYPFDVDFLDANTFQIDGYNFKEADVVQSLKVRKVRVYLLAVYEDVGAPWYCEIFRAGLHQNNLVSILALSWWGDTWVKEQVDMLPDIPCTFEEVFEACRTMFSFGQSAFLLDNVRRHGITGKILSEIRNEYFDPVDGCIAPEYTGCHTDFASYDYDGFALVAMAFHKWIYDEGHSLSEIDYDNPAPQRELYEITKNMKFLGVTGNVEFFKSMDLDCERKGTFSVRQYRYLAIKGGDNGWADITSFTNADGFASPESPWTPIIWWDGTETLLGTGFGWRQPTPGKPTNYDNANGFENIPVDFSTLTCPPGEEPDDQGKACQPCQAGRASQGGTDVFCSSCEIGYFSKDPGQRQCDKCELGQRAINDYTACEDCPAGTRGVDGVCDPCGSGSYSAGAGNRFCAKCTKGRYQPEQGMDACLVCQPGNISNEADPTWCKMCEPGFYQDSPEQGECYRCPSGRYQPTSGAAECQLCKNARTTAFEGALEETDCICPEGAYEPNSDEAIANFQCENCKVGMTCELGSRLRDWEIARTGGDVNGSRVLKYPKLQVKFFSEADRPVFVYKCMEEDDCPGGDPGKCAEKKIGLACGRCEREYYEFGGKCHRCTSIEMTTILFPILPCIVGPPLLFFTYTRLLEPMRVMAMDSVKNQAIAIVFFIIAHFSSVGIVRQFNLNLPDLVVVPWETMGMVNSGVQFLRPECAGGAKMSDFSFQFTMRSLLPIFVAIFFACSFGLSYGAKQVMTDHLGKPGFLGAMAKGMELRPTINAYGTLMYTFSIAILAMAFDLFKCFEHPNKLDSMRVAPDVLCYEDTWNGLLVVGIGSILLYCVGSLALFSWVCFQAPKRFADEDFRMTWKFLLVKWRPNKWWFGQFFLCKGIFLTLPLVLFQSGALQSFWAALVFEAYMIALLMWYPWRHEKSNLLDLCTTGALLGLVLTCIYFSDHVEEAEDGLEKFILIFTLLPILASAGSLASMARGFFSGEAPMVQGTRAAAHATERIQKLAKMGPLTVMKGCVNLTQYEMRALLENLDMVLIEANCTPGISNRLVQRLAVKKTGDTGTYEEDLVSLKENKDITEAAINHDPNLSFDRNTMLKAMDIYEEGAVNSMVCREIMRSASHLVAEDCADTAQSSKATKSNGATESKQPPPPVMEESYVQIPPPQSAMVYSLLKPKGATASTAEQQDVFSSQGLKACSKPRGRPGPDMEQPKTTDMPLPYNWNM